MKTKLIGNDISGYFNLRDEADIKKVYEIYKQKSSLRKTAEFLSTNKGLLARVFKKSNLEYLSQFEANKEYFNKKPKKIKVKKDRRQTCLAKYGVLNVRQNKDINDKIIKKRTDRYIERLNKKLEKAECEMLDPFTRVQTPSGKYLFYTMKHKCGHIFKTDLRRDIKCPKCFYVNRFSSFETIYKDFLKSINIPFDENKKVLPQYELDIYCPDKKIGFEFNGAYWHSVDKKGRNYHSDKTKAFNNEGIKVYHFWDYQNTDLIKSVMKAKLGLSENVAYARKLKVVSISSTEAKEFLNNYHLDGYAKASIRLALVDSFNEILSVMTARRNKENWELCRYANKSNYNVCGGFSKLLKSLCEHIKKLNPNVEKLISYCNRDIAPDYKDTVYFKNNFTFEGDSGSILKYYVKKTESVVNRQYFQKHKLSQIIRNYNPDLTSDENLIMNNIFPIRNSGNWKFTYKLKET